MQFKKCFQIIKCQLCYHFLALTINIKFGDLDISSLRVAGNAILIKKHCMSLFLCFFEGGRWKSELNIQHKYIIVDL